MQADTYAAISDFVVSNFLFGDRSRLPAGGTSLIESGVIDSTGVLELIEFLEDEFAISVAESETVPDNLGSLDNLVRFVTAKRTSDVAV